MRSVKHKILVNSIIALSTLFMSGCVTGTNTNMPLDSTALNNVRLPNDTRILNEQLLIDDPVGFFELSWIRESIDTQDRVIPALLNRYELEESGFHRLRYAMSLQALGHFNNQDLSNAYIHYARELIEQERVGVAFSFLSGDAIRLDFMDNEDLIFFLETANEHRLIQSTQNLAALARSRGLDLSSLNLDWIIEARRPNQWALGVVTVIVDSGFTSRRGVPRQDMSVGSGFFIDRSGYLVTNYHVISPMIEGARRATTTLSVRIDQLGVIVPAQIIGYSKATDMALLRAIYEPEFAFDLLDSMSRVEQGQRVYAVGAPLGLGSTITAGLISNMERRIITPVGGIMQIDVPVNPGNSGGPLLDEEGRVVGVIFAGLSDFQGINFALPTPLLRAMLPKMAQGGEAEMPYLGVSGFHRLRQVELLYVGGNSQARRAGLQNFLPVQQAAGINATSISIFQEAVLTRFPNTIILVRQNNQDIPVVLQQRPELPGAHALLRDGDLALFPTFFGAQVRAVDARNLVIERVYPGMALDTLGFLEGDVLTYFGRNRRAPREFFVAMIRARMRRMGSMDTQMMLTAALESGNWI